MLGSSQIPILVSALPSLLTLLLPSFIFKRMGEWEYGAAVVLEKTLEPLHPIRFLSLLGPITIVGRKLIECNGEDDQGDR